MSEAKIKPVFQLVLNSDNAVLDQPNPLVLRPTYSSFTFEFSGTPNLTGKVVALANLSIFYSWYSITSLFNNDGFSYIWPTAAGPVQFDVSIPDGFYTIPELQAYFEFVMFQNGTYLVSTPTPPATVGSPVFYMSFATNPTLYAIQFNSVPVPTAAQATAMGLTMPANYPVGGLPLTPSTPQLIVNNANFGKVIGFAGTPLTPVTYPAVVQATNYSIDSTFTPEVSPVNSVIMTIDIGNNPYNVGLSTVLYTFGPVNTAFGSNIYIQPPQLLWTDVNSGSYKSLTVTFLDQDGNLLRILDPSAVITLVIRDK
jgi:hypothetical protein